MKKNLLMAFVVATLLLGVLVVINKVSAATALITLQVNAWWFSCSTLPTAVDFGTATWSSSIVTLTGDTWTSWFTCIDLASTWSTQMVAISGPLTGATTWVIAASNIIWNPAGSGTTQIVTTNWQCSGLSLGVGGSLEASRTIISKVGIKTCSFTYAPDGMYVNIPAWSPVNLYTATMTITIPA